MSKGGGSKIMKEALDNKCKMNKKKSISQVCVLAVGICLLVGIGILFSNVIRVRNKMIPLKVYAYGTNQELKETQAITTTGSIDDNGTMKGQPLMFYFVGEDIQSIRFSCKNEWISFRDWTKKRGSYGFSKNFTVEYGRDEEDYNYLVINWEPWSLIRKLTDEDSIVISDLPVEEREDVIVVEVRYLNGEKEDLVIQICLNEEGQFVTSISPYLITEKDTFVQLPDNQITVEETIYGTKEEGEEILAESKLQMMLTPQLSDTEFLCVKEMVVEYYASINREVIRMEQGYFEWLDYEDYKKEEVIMFEIFTNKDEVSRYIVIGSKNNWEKSEIINEGF